MEHHYGAETRIQQMVKHILGDDGDLPAKVDMVKRKRSSALMDISSCLLRIIPRPSY